MSAPADHSSSASLDVGALRRHFPILERTVHGKPLVYLDNAATTQRPASVIDAVDRFYRHYNANVHRGVHQLSVEASEAFEGARQRLAHFIHAASDKEIVFTRGTTEAINLVANGFLRPRLKAGDEIIVSAMEHHANIVPWQLACEALGARLKVLPMDETGTLLCDELPEIITPQTRLVAVVHVSNALGTINPIQSITEIASAQGVPVLVDGAQATPHLAVDVQTLGCDFYCLSGHKMYGPTGIGALWAKAERLEEMVPWQGGGDMIRHVTFERTTYNDVPYRFEAGTPHIAGAIGLAAAVDFIDQTGIDRMARHEQSLLEYATSRLSEMKSVRLIGQAQHKSPVISFVSDKAHANDIGTIVDHFGVALRTGHHCAMPAMQFFGVAATTRVSFAAYNTMREVDVFIEALERAEAMLVS